MVSELRQKVNDFWVMYKSDIFTAFAVFLIGMMGFGLGRLSVIMPEKHEIQVTKPLSANDPEKESNKTAAIVKIVASKNGSTYYFPWCSNNIKEENKIYFNDEQGAEGAGYRLAKNCEK